MAAQFLFTVQFLHLEPGWHVECGAIWCEGATLQRRVGGNSGVFVLFMSICVVEVAGGRGVLIIIVLMALLIRRHSQCPLTITETTEIVKHTHIFSREGRCKLSEAWSYLSPSKHFFYLIIPCHWIAPCCN